MDTSTQNLSIDVNRCNRPIIIFTTVICSLLSLARYYLSILLPLLYQVAASDGERERLVKDALFYQERLRDAEELLNR